MDAKIGHGLKFWSQGQEPATIDVVAVQGLGANPYYTWIGKTKPSKVGKRAKEVHWLRDLLPSEFPTARIATYSYRSDWTNSSIKTSLRQCGDQFLNILFQHRQQSEEQRRPLILIGHSLGGLVIQQALVLADHRPEFSDIHFSIAGIIFLGTPFRGSSAATYAKWLAPLIRGDNTLLRTLERDSPDLHAMSSDFCSSYHDCDVTCFYEMELSEYGPWKTEVATPQSSTLPGRRQMFLDTDHKHLNKFTGPQDSNYRLILQEIRRLSIRKPSAVHGRPRQFSSDAPPIRSPTSDFVGRDKQLADIQAKLSGGRPCPKVAIWGLGGVGKTQIALTFAQQTRKTFPNRSIFWISAVSSESVTQAYKEIARHLELDVGDGQDAQLIVSVHDYLRRTEAGQWLLIFDNLDDLGVFSDSSTNSQPTERFAFPENDDGAILITTRTREIATMTARSEVIEIQKLDPELAEQLLFKLLIDKERITAEPEAARELLHYLTYLPLAITQAALYINVTGIRISEYLELLQGAESTTIQTLSRNFEHEYQFSTGNTSVAATWLISFRQVKKKSALAADLLSVLSCIEPVAIPKSILEGKAPDEQVVYAIGQLCTYAFIVQRRHAPMYDMHRLVHLAARNWVQGEGHSRQASIQAIQRLRSNLPYTWRDYDPRVYLPLLPHAQKVLSEYCGERNMLWLELSYHIGDLLYRDGRFEESVLRLLDPDKWAQASLAPDDVWKLRISTQIALSYRNNREDTKTIEILESALGGERASANDHPERLYSLGILATAYSNESQTARAIEILEYVVRVQSSSLRENHPDRLTSQHQLASAYLHDGQYQKAIEILEHVVRMRSSSLREDHPDRLISQHQLASAYLDIGQYQKAIDILEHVVRIESSSLREVHPDRLISQHQLASAYLDVGRSQKAVEILEHVARIRSSTLREDHRDRLASQHELARAYLHNGQSQKAIEILEHVVRIRSSSLRKDHPDRLRSEELLTKAKQAAV